MVLHVAAHSATGIDTPLTERGPSASTESAFFVSYSQAIPCYGASGWAAYGLAALSGGSINPVRRTTLSMIDTVDTVGKPNQRDGKV